MAIRIAFSSLAYPHLQLPELVKRVKMFRVDGLELRVSDDGIHLKPVYPVPRDVIELVETSGVKIPIVSGYATFSHSDPVYLLQNMKLAKTLVHIAHALGAFGVRVVIGKTSGVNVVDSLTRALRTINDLSHYAETYNVMLLVETHDDFANPNYLLKLVDLLGDNVGLVYDVANVMMAGGRHDQVFPAIYRKVKHVHLKDYVVCNGVVRYTEPGKGLVPICQVVEDLVKAGYDNYVSVEWEKLWHPELEDPDTMIPRYVDYIRRCVKNTSESEEPSVPLLKS